MIGRSSFLKAHRHKGKKKRFFTAQRRRDTSCHRYGWCPCNSSHTLIRFAIHIFNALMLSAILYLKIRPYRPRFMSPQSFSLQYYNRKCLVRNSYKSTQPNRWRDTSCHWYSGRSSTLVKSCARSSPCFQNPNAPKDETPQDSTMFTMFNALPYFPPQRYLRGCSFLHSCKRTQTQR